MRVPLVLVLGLAMAGGAWPQEATAKAWSVEEDGDDGGAGTQQDPFATLQHAADQVRAGDVVAVGPGRYAGFIVDSDPERAGRQGNT